MNYGKVQFFYCYNFDMKQYIAILIMENPFLSEEPYWLLKNPLRPLENLEAAEKPLRLLENFKICRKGFPKNLKKTLFLRVAQGRPVLLNGRLEPRSAHRSGLEARYHRRLPEEDACDKDSVHARGWQEDPAEDQNAVLVDRTSFHGCMFCEYLPKASYYSYHSKFHNAEISSRQKSSLRSFGGEKTFSLHKRLTLRHIVYNKVNPYVKNQIHSNTAKNHFL